MDDNILLKVEEMSKNFGITRALKDVHFELNYGEIHGLIGENGSGKSTLSSIIAAITKADEGTMVYEGEAYLPATSVEANNMGVCMILQEKGTFDRLTVASNIFAGKEDLFVEKGSLNVGKINKAAQEVLESVHAGYIKAADLIDGLSFEDRKLVELARAMYSNPKILIVDETTTALSRDGRNILFRCMEDLKKKSNSVIFISHDLDELTEVCDRLTVLRDGDYIATLEKKDYVPSQIRRLMVGREVAEDYYRADADSSSQDEVVMKVDGLYAPGLRNINFELHRGEILGFGGLADCGMHLLGSMCFGLSEPDFGSIYMNNKKKVTNPLAAATNKIAYLSKNRDAESLMISANILDNICVASYGQVSSGPFIWKKNEKKFGQVWADKLEIKMQNMEQFVAELSGGNKQKVALAKWLGFGADVFIMDCPTRGIDIGVKTNIYRLMMELKEQGKSILLISEEMQEVIGMSDRIIILKEGSISGEFRREDCVTEQMLIEYMI